MAHINNNNRINTVGRSVVEVHGDVVGVDFTIGDICIQNFHLGRYIVGYTVGNLVLRRHVSGAVKRDFRMYIRRYTSPNENFEYGYPHSNALLISILPKNHADGDKWLVTEINNFTSI